MALADELSKLAELREKGGLTEEEFARAKERAIHGDAKAVPEPSSSGLNRFRLSRTDQWIGGVCGGLGKLTGLESWIWRLLFAILFIIGGVGLLAYVLLWIFVPRE